MTSTSTSKLSLTTSGTPQPDAHRTRENPHTPLATTTAQRQVAFTQPPCQVRRLTIRWDGNGPWGRGAVWGARGWLMGIGMIVILVAVVLLVVYLVRSTTTQQTQTHPPALLCCAAGASGGGATGGGERAGHRAAALRQR